MRFISNKYCHKYNILSLGGYIVVSIHFFLKFGEKHEKTQESSDCLKHLTHQAVVLQKKMNEIYTGKTSVTLPPIQIHPPSMGSVLDMLNIINGILYVQIRCVITF